jgi:hypothetical protein
MVTRLSAPEEDGFSQFRINPVELSKKKGADCPDRPFQGARHAVFNNCLILQEGGLIFWYFVGCPND